MDEDAEIRARLNTIENIQLTALPPEEVRRLGSARKRRAIVNRSIIATCLATLVVAGTWYGIRAEVSTPNVASRPGDSHTPVLLHKKLPTDFLGELSSGGTLTLSHGCLLFADDPIVWPPGSRWDGRSRSVSFTSLGRQFAAQVGHPVPSGIAAGIVPFRDAARFLDPQTAGRVRTCLGKSGVVMVVN